MESIEEARTKILKEIKSDDTDVRANYLKHFESDVEEFSEAMAQAVINWQSLHTQAKDDTNLGQVSTWVITAISLHILSMKLFVSGHTVPAGNVFRQVVETIALALLCSADQHVISRVKNGKYSTNKALQQLLQRTRKLGIDKEAVRALKIARTFYDNYSHPTLHTIWAGVSLSESAPYVGASFDDEKLEIYAKEMQRRLELSVVFNNFVDAVKANVAKW